MFKYNTGQNLKGVLYTDICDIVNQTTPPSPNVWQWFMKWRCVKSLAFSQIHHKPQPYIKLAVSTEMKTPMTGLSTLPYTKPDVLMIDGGVTDNNTNRIKAPQGLDDQFSTPWSWGFYPLKSQDIRLNAFQLGTNVGFRILSSNTTFLVERNSIATNL